MNINDPLGHRAAYEQLQADAQAEAEREEALLRAARQIGLSNLRDRMSTGMGSNFRGNVKTAFRMPNELKILQAGAGRDEPNKTYRGRRILKLMAGAGQIPAASIQAIRPIVAADNTSKSAADIQTEADVADWADEALSLAGLAPAVSPPDMRRDPSVTPVPLLEGNVQFTPDLINAAQAVLAQSGLAPSWAQAILDGRVGLPPSSLNSIAEAQGGALRQGPSRVTFDDYALYGIATVQITGTGAFTMSNTSLAQAYEDAYLFLNTGAGQIDRVTAISVDNNTANLGESSGNAAGIPASAVDIDLDTNLLRLVPIGNVEKSISVTVTAAGFGGTNFNTYLYLFARVRGDQQRANWNRSAMKSVLNALQKGALAPMVPPGR